MGSAALPCLKASCAQESEQKVRLLIGKLDKMRTLHGPGLKQIVDLVQQINDARSPEPDGRNSRYSRLFVSPHSIWAPSACLSTLQEPATFVKPAVPDVSLIDLKHSSVWLGLLVPFPRELPGSEEPVMSANCPP